MTNHVSFGELLQGLRKKQKISQRVLASKIGVHYNTIWGWERGDYLPDSKGMVLELGHQLYLNDQETRQLLEASLTALSPHWLLPFPRNSFFVGREKVINQIHDFITHDHKDITSRYCSLSGLGGIGKTQTAIEYAYRFANNYTAVFWINAETYNNIISSMVTIATQLNLPEKQEQDQEKVTAAVAHWLINHRDWLLIFDNIEDPALVKRFLPPARSGSFLYTSRRQSIGLDARTLNLEPMTLEEGMRFLLRRSQILEQEASLDQLSPREKLLAQEIVTAIDGLPLALDQAAAYIEATRCSMADYLHLFQTSQVRLLDERDIYADHPMSVTKTFLLAFEQLKRRNSAAVELLIVCAFLAPDQIPEDLLVKNTHMLGPTLQSAIADPFLFNTAMKEILSYSLLQRHSQTSTFTIHRLVQTILRMTMDEDAQRQWATQVVCMVNTVFPDFEEELSHYAQAQLYLSHAINCASLIQTYNIISLEAGRLLSQTGSHLIDMAHYTQAETILEQAYILHAQLQGPEHPEVAFNLNDRAEIKRLQGKYTQAETLYKQALTILENTLGFEHVRVASTLNNLGLLYYYQHKYEQAEPFYHHALAIYKIVRGEDDTHVAMSLNNLALLYTRQSKYAQAETLYQQTLTIVEKNLGPDHRRTATSLNNLAKLYYLQDKYEQAEQLYLRVLTIHKAIDGEDDLQVSLTLNNLALLYTRQHKYTQAESLFQRALQMRLQLLGPEHPRTAQSLSDLASLFLEQKQYAQALPLFQQALSIQEKVLEIDHPDRIATLERYQQLVAAIHKEDKTHVV
ncbi:MAG: helix-turn-helix transcriptional regulator [Ktedonobacteraceae bacterium]|nr:helix-turn-helix transcriptional regulator [Ktedonobacteraceae bacterium]